MKKNNQEKADSLISSLNLDQEDLRIWPLEQVQENFKEFMLATRDFDLQEAMNRIDFPQDMELPTEDDQLEQMFQKSMSKIQGRQNKKKWKDNEKQFLTCIIIRYCAWKLKLCKDLSDQDWRFIARLIVGRNATQCKYKWLARSKFKLVQVPWSKEEDEALSQIYLEYQKMGKHSKWSEIAKEIALRCRTSIVRQGKQCRERWINKLDPQISKGPWTKEEELTLLQLILKKGKKWSEISKIMRNTRTENSLKNRYHTIMKKERNKHGEPQPVEQDEIVQLLQNHNHQVNADNLVHLYEDIDPKELKIILQVIDRLVEQTGKSIKVSTLITDQRLQQEQAYQQQEKIKKETKQESADIKAKQENEQQGKRRFLDNMESIRLDMESQLKKLQQKNELDPLCTISLIKHMLKPQELEINQHLLDQHYEQMLMSIQSSQIEFEVDAITCLAKDQLDDCQFGIVDFENNNLYVMPQQYIQEVTNKIRIDQQQQAMQLSGQEAQRQQILHQQQQHQQAQMLINSQNQSQHQLSHQHQQFLSQSLHSQNVASQQMQSQQLFDQFNLTNSLQNNEFDMPPQYTQQYPVQIMYPQIIYQPLATSLNMSQGLHQSYWMTSSYYPYYVNSRDNLSQPYILKQENIEQSKEIQKQ